MYKFIILFFKIYLMALFKVNFFCKIYGTRCLYRDTYYFYHNRILLIRDTKAVIS